MSNFIHWIIFVQIISESWPISSSSHVRIVFMLAPLLFGAQALEQSVPNFLDHLLHGPMVLIVLIFFRHAWVHWVRRVVRIARAYVCGARVRESERAFVRVLARLVSFLFCSSVITGIFFGLFKILLKNNALLAHDATMLVGLCVTAGVLFLLRSLRDTTLRVVPQGERNKTPACPEEPDVLRQAQDDRGLLTSALPEEPDEAFSEDRRLEGPRK